MTEIGNPDEVASMPLQADVILRGAYYAAEQAGRLLNDALILYKSRCWGSALVLAAFCLEELGKAEILLERAVRANRDGPMPKSRVLEGLSKHPIKLGAGRGPVSIAPAIFFFGDPPQPDSREMAELHRRHEQASRIALQNAPGETHQARMRALYVDLGEYDWQRPAEITSQETYLLLSAAAIEYETRREKFVSPREPYVAEASSRLTPLLLSLSEAPCVPWPEELPAVG